MHACMYMDKVFNSGKELVRWLFITHNSSCILNLTWKGISKRESPNILTTTIWSVYNSVLYGYISYFKHTRSHETISDNKKLLTGYGWDTPTRGNTGDMHARFLDGDDKPRVRKSAGTMALHKHNWVWLIFILLIQKVFVWFLTYCAYVYVHW